MESSKTNETIMRRMNLEPFESYADRIIKKQRMDPILQKMNPNGVGRGTGQTTRMLVEALAYLVDTEETIMIVAHDKTYAIALKRQLGTMAARCGFINLNHDRVKVGYMSEYMKDSYKDYEDAGSIFIDHHAWTVQYEQELPTR